MRLDNEFFARRALAIRSQIALPSLVRLSTLPVVVRLSLDVVLPEVLAFLAAARAFAMRAHIALPSLVRLSTAPEAVFFTAITSRFN